MTWQPNFKELYELELAEIEELSKLGVVATIPKWKKDLLLFLKLKSLEKKPPKARHLRKLVKADLEEIFERSCYLPLKKTSQP